MDDFCVDFQSFTIKSEVSNDIEDLKKCPKTWISLISQFHITRLPQSLVDDYLFATKVIIEALKTPNYDILEFYIKKHPHLILSECIETKNYEVLKWIKSNHPSVINKDFVSKTVTLHDGQALSILFS